MGESASGMLVYGIDIGSPDGYGTLGPIGGEYGDELQVDWLDENLDLPFDGQLIVALARRSGWNEPPVEDGDEPDDSDANEFTEKTLGVGIVGWGNYDYGHWLLAPVGEQFRLDSGGYNLRVVEPAGLNPPDLDEVRAKLENALKVLGLTTTRRPAWLLVADYG